MDIWGAQRCSNQGKSEKNQIPEQFSVLEKISFCFQMSDVSDEEPAPNSLREITPPQPLIRELTTLQDIYVTDAVKHRPQLDKRFKVLEA
ncbi:hypothetical protein CEXT_671801 [Caerostris extrusa]|uniref:Uncharacterized protein n=1 Tax=Caerostris extrusa TaxID=172846 RepID=A0AAV4XMP4_CAEEX|nr:hypothetical protein CEXT_671801 [Caerostris extrusa]